MRKGLHGALETLRVSFIRARVEFIFCGQVLRAFTKNYQRHMALFFIGIIILQAILPTISLNLSNRAIAAESESTSQKSSNQEDPAQINTNYKDSRAKGGKSSQPINIKQSKFESTSRNFKEKPLAATNAKNDVPVRDLESAKNKIRQNIKNHEKIEKRTAFSNTYGDEKGLELTQVGQIAQNYKDTTGKWQKISFDSEKDEEYQKQFDSQRSLLKQITDVLTLDVLKPAGYKSTSGSIKTSFNTLGHGGIVYVTPNGKVTIRPESTKMVRPEYQQNESGNGSVIYKGVWPGVDLMYEYRGVSIKEYTIIKQLPKDNVFKFKVEGSKVKNVNGHIEFEGDLKGKYAVGDLSLKVGKRGEINNPPVHQYASGDGQEIIVEFDKSWLKSQDKSSYPMVIDPALYDVSYIPGGYTGQFWPYKSDGYVGSSQTSNINTGTLNDNGTKAWRTLVNWPYTQLKGRQLLDANVYIKMMISEPWWHGTYDGHTVYIDHATCFSYGCYEGPEANGIVGGDGNINVRPLIQMLIDRGDWGGILMARGEEWWTGSFKEIDPRVSLLQLWSNVKPSQISPELPSADPNTEAVLTTTSPQLRVTAASDGNNSESLQYSFAVLSGGGQTLWQSGWSPSRSVVVPEGILEDGSSYSWQATVTDGWATNPTIQAGKFKVTVRNGKDKSQTYDEIGPESINLATGNLYTAVGSHSVSALGGNIGLNLSYNSPLSSKNGLSAEYFNNTSWSGNPVYRRVDPNIQFDWGNGTAVPGITNNDNFGAHFSGYFVAPYDGTFNFGSMADDYLRIDIDGQTVVSYTCCNPNVSWSSGVALKAGQIKKIDAYYYENGGGANSGMFIKSDKEPNQQNIPNSWLKTNPLLAKPSQGLVGHYYFDSGNHDFNTNKNQFMSRLDSSVDFDWGNGSPTPNGPTDNFLVRWEGYITVPSTGNYSFGTITDDGARLYVNNQNQVDQWKDQGWTQYMGQPLSLTAGQTLPIKMEFYEKSVGAGARLVWNGPNGNGVIPSVFLSPGPQLLPSGWNLSADADGNLAFERINPRQNGDVAVYDADGSEKVFTSTGTGYKPPINESAILTKNSDGSFNLLDSVGRTYLFNSDGTLKLTTTPPDDRKPAALQYEYSSSSGIPKLKKIIDAVDPSRFGTVLYQEDNSCQTSPAGFDTSPPIGNLCGFETTDGQKTAFYYKSGKLARIVLPGAATQDFGYDTAGMLTSVRDGLANDAITAGVIADDANATTEIAYDILARASTITTPKPSSNLTRATHSIEYLPGSTKQHLQNAPEPAGYSQYIEYDGLLRTNKVCDVQGLCTSTEWDPVKDLVLSSTNPLGLKSTSIYDDTDLLLHSYGPAPSSWYNSDRTPNTAYAGQVAHTESKFDQNLYGPAVAYYNYKAFATQSGNSGLLFGAPKIHTTGINASQENFSQSWSNPPITVDTDMQGWGLSATGRIKLDTSGDYKITVSSNDGIKLWIDNTAVIDDFKDGALRDRSYTLQAVANKTYQFKLDYYDLKDSNAPTLTMNITPPMGSPSSNMAGKLRPAYDLKTSTTIYDAQLGDVTTTNSYSDPALGQLTSANIDPGGLNLNAQSGYETPGSGYLRQTSKTMPGGNKYQYIYYGATETADNPCTTTSVEIYHQAGRARKTIQPDPDGSGAAQSITMEMIYDDAGKIVASRTGNEAWNCNTYDSRGRTTQVIIPAQSGRVGRNITTNYSYGGNPLVTSVAEGTGGYILTTKDLVGRVVSYQDVWGVVTNTTYNDLGQILTKASPMGDETFTYDNYGHLLTQSLGSNLLANLTYDSYGRISNITYPYLKDPTTGAALNLNQVYRDPGGKMTGANYTLPSGFSVRDQVTYSQSGRVYDESINDIDLSPGAKSYEYDTAGRLTTARIAGHNFNYNYTNLDPSCATANNMNPNAGKNSNRLSQSIDGVVTNYCYNYADQLTKSSDSKFDAPTYDNHGNTRTIGTGSNLTTFSYDQSNRNMSITQGTDKVTYNRDVDGRVVQRRNYIGGLNTQQRYAHTSDKAYSYMFTNLTTKAPIEIYISLPGGINMTYRPSETTVAEKYRTSLRNMHGDTMGVINGTGGVDTGIMLYDPFGTRIASTADFASANPIFAYTTLTGGENMKANQQMLWAGSERRSAETTFASQPIQMGARIYIPGLGRFLQVDPVEGGTPNDYVYVTDPINSNDYSGQWAFLAALASPWVILTIAVVIVTIVIISSPQYRQAVHNVVQDFSQSSSSSSSSSQSSSRSRPWVSASSVRSPMPPNCKPKRGNNGRPNIRLSGIRDRYGDLGVKAATKLEQMLLDGTNQHVGPKYPGQIVNETFLQNGLTEKYLADVDGIELHYMFNPKTCEYDDIKDPSKTQGD